MGMKSCGKWRELATGEIWESFISDELAQRPPGDRPHSEGTFHEYTMHGPRGQVVGGLTDGERGQRWEFVRAPGGQ